MNVAGGPATIRRATPQDGPIVRAFVVESLLAFGIEPDLEDKDSDVARFGEHGPEIDEFVAELDGAVVGSIMVSPHGGGVGWLSKFFVDERHQGLGIGRALLAHATEAARARGYRRLRLDTRAVMRAAVHLYEATGWRLEPDPPTDGPCDAFYSLDL
jgi:GNAT superfamily N-acetyltransferase